MKETEIIDAIDSGNYNMNEYSLRQVTQSYQNIAKLMRSLRRTKNETKREEIIQKIKFYSNIILPSIASKWADKGKGPLLSQIKKIAKYEKDPNRTPNPHDSIILACLIKEYEKLTGKKPPIE